MREAEPERRRARIHALVVRGELQSTQARYILRLSPPPKTKPASFAEEAAAEEFGATIDAPLIEQVASRKTRTVEKRAGFLPQPKSGRLGELISAIETQVERFFEALSPRSERRNEYADSLAWHLANCDIGPRMDVAEPSSLRSLEEHVRWALVEPLTRHPGAPDDWALGESLEPMLEWVRSAVASVASSALLHPDMRDHRRQRVNQMLNVLHQRDTRQRRHVHKHRWWLFRALEDAAANRTVPSTQAVRIPDRVLTRAAEGELQRRPPRNTKI